MNRRMFLALSSAAVGGVLTGFPKRTAQAAAVANSPFKISLAQWSLNRTIRAGKMTNLDFPRVAKEEFGIDCVEYVDQFFADKSKDQAYLKELKQRAADQGVTNNLIMLDTNGPLGVRNERARQRAIQKTCDWIDAAQFLGCKSIRINARGEKDPNELRKYMAESGVQLADYAAERDINVTIENHGGPSSDPVWLTTLMKDVGKPNFGTLPDFGNFPAEVNRYDAVEMFMPYAKAVSAKSMGFTDDGLVKETDYFRMMRIVLDGGYTGYIGVESAPGSEAMEAKAICMTRDLLKRIFAEQANRVSLFNGKDLSGWKVVHGGEWTVEDDVIIGRNGIDWSTDPETTGSWLRSEKQYADFRLELQYAINEGGNSGVFFRSAAEKNPAFTGYEMQITDFAGKAPTKSGATAIYDVVAPSENRVKPAGQWNTVTIIAKGNNIQFEMNGATVVDINLDRSAKGYIGLQNHDKKSVVKYRNIRIETL